MADAGSAMCSARRRSSSARCSGARSNSASCTAGWGCPRARCRHAPLPAAPGASSRCPSTWTTEDPRCGKHRGRRSEPASPAPVPCTAKW